MDAIEAAFCVNTSAVWATGGSNGGIFVYELASDARMAGRLAGIAPVTGLPHKGFLQPARGLHYISMLGATDGTVPPFSAGDTPSHAAPSLRHSPLCVSSAPLSRPDAKTETVDRGVSG